MGSDCDPELLGLPEKDELDSVVQDYCLSWINDLPFVWSGLYGVQESQDKYYLWLEEFYQDKITDTKRIQQLIISSSRINADQKQYGIECLQEGIEYFMKGIEDIHGGTRSGAELQFKKGKDCIFKGIPCDFGNMREYILDQRASEDIEVHQGTNGSPINSEYNYQQGIEYIGGPEPTPSNCEVLPEHEYNYQQGMEYIRESEPTPYRCEVQPAHEYKYQQGMEYIRGSEPTPYRCEVQPAHEYKYQQGMEYIRGLEPTPYRCEVQPAHKYSNQQGMEYIRGPEPTPTPSDREVLQHGYNNQQGMEHIRGPSRSPFYTDDI